MLHLGEFKYFVLSLYNVGNNVLFVFFISLPVILVTVEKASSLILHVNKVPTLKNAKGVQLQMKQKYNNTAFYV